MEKIDIEIRNGYGISHLKYSFVFNVASSPSKLHNSIVSVYAQNGTMKSSFTKTLRDHVLGYEIKD